MKDPSPPGSGRKKVTSGRGAITSGGTRRGSRTLAHVEFSPELRDGVLSGEITVSIRLWKSPKVKEGRRYRVGEAEIQIDAIELIVFAAVTRADLRRSGERDLEEDAMTDAEQPEAAASRAEVRRLLECNIDALPDQFRTAFILREVEEMSVDEAAACLGVPAATVRSRTFRARALLREAMAREVDVATVHAFGFAGERCDRIVAGVLARWREPG